ncbi:MAG: DUF4363 family protein [Clostridia bacterium]|nr:DUF4363 family protein [Clostridia bacterium]
MSVTILLLVAAVCGTCEWYNGASVRRYRLALMPVEAALDGGQWEEALRLTQQISIQWEREAGFIQLWINHADTDAVTHALRGLEISARNADFLSAMLFYGDCVENFDHLHHRDAFTLKNIL